MVEEVYVIMILIRTILLPISSMTITATITTTTTITTSSNTSNTSK